MGKEIIILLAIVLAVSPTYVQGAYINPSIATIRIGEPATEFLLRGPPGSQYLASASFGTTPGIQIGQINVPLNPDALFFLTVAGYLSPFFQSFSGTLNQNGESRLYVALPNDPLLVGLRFYLAFVAYDGTGILEASNSASVNVFARVQSLISLPFPLLNMAYAFDSATKRLYIFSGSSDFNGAIKNVYRFDFNQPIMNVMQQDDPLPQEMIGGFGGGAAAWVSSLGKAFVFGGYGNMGDRVSVFDPQLPAGQRITVMNDVRLPTPQAFLSAVYDPGTDRVFIFYSKMSGAGATDVYKFNPHDGSIVVLSNVRPASDGGATLLPQPNNQNDIILCCGASMSVVRFNIQTERGVSITTAQLPTFRTFFPVTFNPASGKVLIIGGSTGGGIATNEVFAFDPQTNTINQIAQLPTGMYGHGSIALPSPYNKVVIFGGYKSALGRTDQFFSI